MTQREVEQLSRKRILALLREQSERVAMLELVNSELKRRIRDREEQLDRMNKLAEIIGQKAELQEEELPEPPAPVDKSALTAPQAPEKKETPLEELSRKRMLETLAAKIERAENLEQENGRIRTRIGERETHLASMVILLKRSMPHLPKGQYLAASEMLSELELMNMGVLGDVFDESELPPRWNDEDEHLPTRSQLLIEAMRQSGKSRYFWSLKTTIYALTTVAAVAVLVAVLLLPVLQIYGSSMNPTLYEGDFVVCIKRSKMQTGDMVAFYYNNKILVKRVIAQAGQWVNITEDGTVYVDEREIWEPYLSEKAFGECDLKLPYQVPEGRVFVMGDNRSLSVDSRSTTIGCVSEEQVVGRIVFRIWPLNQLGKIGV